MGWRRVVIDEGAVGVASGPASQAAATRRVRDAGADATAQAATGLGSAGATVQSAGLRLYGHRRSQPPHVGGRAGTAARPTARRPPGRLGEPVGSLWTRLTDRDRRILALVGEHKVLTTEQLAVLEYGSKTRAQHRLRELHGLDVLWRFRFPRIAGGSYPWHYALGYTGARLIAAQKAVRPPRPAEHQQHLERLVESPKLRHQLGVNDFFVALAYYARQHERSHPIQGHILGLDTWRSEGWITDFHDRLVRPDGFGCWAERNRLTRFYLEYDTGTETLDRVAAKLEDYHHAQQRATYPEFGVVLFTVATARRETGLRAALARSLIHLDDSVAMATTARDYGHPDGPAGPVWASLTDQPDAMRGVRLPDLAHPADPSPAATPITNAADGHRDRSTAALPLPDWLGDEPSEQMILLDPDDQNDASWPA
jgi:hypothetical protein